MKEFIIIRKQVGGREISKKIYRVRSGHLKGLKKIGTAAGPSFEFCTYLAFKHNKDFFERVYGYRIFRGDLAKMMYEVLLEAGINKGKYINVTFYEKVSMTYALSPSV